MSIQQNVGSLEVTYKLTYKNIAYLAFLWGI
jgi:hypothetical protein